MEGELPFWALLGRICKMRAVGGRGGVIPESGLSLVLNNKGRLKAAEGGAMRWGGETGESKKSFPSKSSEDGGAVERGAAHLLQVLAAALRVGVENLDLAVLGLLVDLLGSLDESLLDLLGGLGRGLNEVEAVLLSEGLSLLASDLAGSIHVALVSDEDDDNVVRRALAAVLQPRGEVLEGLTTR